jgi:UDP-N-acetylglucosamine 4,6-dehydratase/5-epimerase
VLGSNGSVVPFFIDQIKHKNKVTITDGNMTRFFLTLEEAISLLFKAAEYSIGGETYVMNMPSFYIKDLAKVLINRYGNSDTKLEEIGIREGEKIHEVLISESEMVRSYIFDNDYYVILPDIKINRKYEHNSNMKHPNFETFSSLDGIKDIDFLQKLLNDGGFLNL